MSAATAGGPTAEPGRDEGEARELPRAVLLDVDGTLLDSIDAHAQAWADALSEFRLGIAPGRVRPLVGMGSDKVVPILTGLSADSPDCAAIALRRDEIFRERYLPRVKAFPYVRDLLAALRERGVALVVATSASRQDLEVLVQRAGVEDMVAGTVSAEDVALSKPDPDIILAALERFHIVPEAAVLVGDTPYDVEAARRAGVAVVALRSGGWSDDALRGARAVLADPAELLGHLDVALGGGCEMPHGPTIGEIMVRDVYTCRAEESLETAVGLMWERDVGCLPVLRDDEDRHPIGIVTDRDVSMAGYLQGRALRDIPVECVMAPDVSTCRDSHTMEAALAIMRARQLHRLPVVDAAHRLVGMVSLKDCARAALADGSGSPRMLTSAVTRTLAAIGAPRPSSRG